MQLPSTAPAADAEPALAEPAPSRWAEVLFLLLLAVPFATRFVATYGGEMSVDLPSFYHGARAVFVEGRSPYGPAAFDAVAMPGGQKVYPYLYPPPSLALFYPLSRVSYERARWLALGVNVACLLASAALLAWKVPLARRGRWAPLLAGPFIIAYALAYQPAVQTVALGQVNLVLLLLLTLAWYAIATGRAWLVGLTLAAAVAIKVYPLIFLPFLLVTRRFRSTAWFGGFLALFCVASLLLPGPLWADFARTVLPEGGYGKAVTGGAFPPGFPSNQSLNGMTARLFLGDGTSPGPIPNAHAGRLVPTLLCALIWLATAACAWCSFAAAGALSDQPPAEADDRWESRRPWHPLLFPAVLLTMFLVAPLGWNHHLTYVLPAAAAGIAYFAFDEGRLVRRAVVAAAALGLAWPLPINRLGSGGAFAVLISANGIAVLVLWSTFAVELLRKPRPAEATQRGADVEVGADEADAPDDAALEPVG